MAPAGIFDTSIISMMSRKMFLLLVCFCFPIIAFGESVSEGVDLTLPIIDGTGGTIVDTKTATTLDDGNNVLSSYVTVDLKTGNLTKSAVKTGNTFPLVGLSCVDTYFIHSLTDDSIPSGLSSSKTNYNLFIVLNGSNISSIDEQFLGKMDKVLIGSFVSSKLDESVENQLKDKGFIVISNLNDGNFHFDSSKNYISYLGFFDYFKNQSVPVASVVKVFEKTKEISEICDGTESQLLSHHFNENSPIFPGYDKPKLDSDEKLTFLDHFGTHIDPPRHFYNEGVYIDKMPEKFQNQFLPCIKVEAKSTKNGSESIGLEVVKQWENESGKTIPKDSIVIFDTGSYKFWDNNEDEYRKMGSDGKLTFTGVDPETVEWLVKSRSISAIAIDTLSTDPGTSSKYPTHVILGKENKIGLENVGNLNKFPNANGFLADKRKSFNPIAKCRLLFLNIKNGTGSPVVIFSHISVSSSTIIFSSTLVTIGLANIALVFQ